MEGGRVSRAVLTGRAAATGVRGAADRGGGAVAVRGGAAAVVVVVTRGGAAAVRAGAGAAIAAMGGIGTVDTADTDVTGRGAGPSVTMLRALDVEGFVEADEVVETAGTKVIPATNQDRNPP